MKQRLSSNWAVLITAVIAFPLTALGIWIQDKLALSGWFHGVWFFLTIVLCVEVWYRIGPVGGVQSFFDVTDLSFKDKVIYSLSTITMFATVIVVAEYLKAINNMAITFVLIVIFLGLCYLPVWLFGSPELKQKLFGKKK